MCAAFIDASSLLPVIALALRQFVRSSPREILALIWLAVYRTVSLFFFISRPPRCDKPYASIAPRPYQGERQHLSGVRISLDGSRLQHRLRVPHVVRETAITAAARIIAFESGAFSVGVQSPRMLRV